MTIIVGAGSSGLIMPQYVATAALVKLKDGSGTAHASNATGFYTAVERTHTDASFDTATLSVVADTNEQTIVDTSGSGVLTQIKSSTITAGAGTVTIRATIDGTVKTFTAVLTNGGADILCIGGYEAWVTITSVSLSNAGIGDVGYAALAGQEICMLGPRQTIAKGGVGIAFSTSLKVTIQADSALDVGSATNKASVSWYTSKPEGV